MAVVDPCIEKLPCTTFFGRRFTRRQIAEIQQTVATFPALSRQELAQTICEHLLWQTPTGGNRVKAALGMLEQLEQASILTLPPKRTQNMRSGPRQPVAPTARTFLLDRHGRRLGCLLFSQATHSLACRDAWVGWPAGAYKKHLDLVLGQPRFLILPWVSVRNLASHALALAARQLPADWQRRYATTPVLLETFVDAQRFRGTCYRAANWECSGQTRARADAGRSPKHVFVYPLSKHFRAILLHGPRPQPRNQWH